MTIVFTCVSSSCCQVPVEQNDRGFAYCTSCGCRRPEEDRADVKRDRERWNRRQARAEKKAAC